MFCFNARRLTRTPVRPSITLRKPCGVLDFIQRAYKWTLDFTFWSVKTSVVVEGLSSVVLRLSLLSFETYKSKIFLITAPV